MSERHLWESVETRAALRQDDIIPSLNVACLGIVLGMYDTIWSEVYFSVNGQEGVEIRQSERTW